MSKLVTILGGSGFVGRYVARRMAQAGWRVRVATRRPSEHLFVRTYGVVGQVEPVLCNIRDDASIRAVLQGADAVVNCAGVLTESGKNSFSAVMAEGPGRVARLATEAGVAHMVHISAIGADAQAESGYARATAAGEAAVLDAFPSAVILRPSVIFGPEDEFFNRFAGMVRSSPILPITAGQTKFQPVYVDDVAEAAAKGATGDAAPGIYELGGPDVMTFRELMAMMLDDIRRNRVIFNMPRWMAGLVSRLMGVVQFLTIGIVKNPLTRDQIADLQRDNVVSGEAKGLTDLGITPTPMELILPTYLWRFRPAGQYAAIKESAKGLRGQE
ncbi:complex I NDUFA9 subunit family protein [Pararhodobacter marinus]|uniref:complex I NDUFA9 subunit family protein n=1 Tax=Pararhodobacter marinus TaxID=2184063 RepID=UPI00351955D5